VRPHGIDKVLVGFAEQCMAEYDLNGWAVSGMIADDDVNVSERR
jgi:hypothetical protein